MFDLYCLEGFFHAWDVLIRPPYKWPSFRAGFTLKGRLCSNCFSTGLVQPLCDTNCYSCTFSSSNRTEPERTHPWSLPGFQLNSRGTQRQADINSHVIGPLNDITAENLGQRGEEERRGAGTMAVLGNMDAGTRISSREMKASCWAESFSHFA